LTINHQPFPSQPGSYVLVLNAPQATTIPVGRLGSLAVTPGCYLYVGSALGAGGLAGRLRHHLRVTPRPHWHIDALRAVTELDAICWLASPARLEHAWAQALVQASGCTVPMPHFGASDCRCPAHLFFLPAHGAWSRVLANVLPGLNIVLTRSSAALNPLGMDAE
jgi:Uri superfamily endonuclease